MRLKFTLVFTALLCVAVRLAAQAPITPDRVIALFNGKDLSGFHTWNRTQGHEDPDHLFSVVDQIDGAPAIRASGQYWGGLITNDRYKNFRIVVEFRWGLLTWGQRKNSTRDSGILLHCQGEEGNQTKAFDGAWMRSVEFQIIEGGTGDALLVNGYDRGKPEVIAPTLKTRVTEGTQRWNPNGVEKEFSKGRIDWLRRDPDWKDVLGFRGRADVEKPLGQWNRAEAICDGGSVTYFLNGTKVNEARDASLTEGRILLQSEGAETYFRRVELHPLKR